MAVFYGIAVFTFLWLGKWVKGGWTNLTVAYVLGVSILLAFYFSTRRTMTHAYRLAEMLVARALHSCEGKEHMIHIDPDYDTNTGRWLLRLVVAVVLVLLWLLVAVSPLWGRPSIPATPGIESKVFLTRVLAAVGLFLNLAGFFLVTRMLYVTKRRAAELVVSRIAYNKPEDNWQLPAGRTMLKDRWWAVAAALLVAVGTALQVWATWI